MEVAFRHGRLHALEEARAGDLHDRIDEVRKAAGRKSQHRWTR